MSRTTTRSYFLVDLKPENLIFKTKDENSDLLIADFGLSRIIDSEKFDVLRTTCGTPGYMVKIKLEFVFDKTLIYFCTF